MGRGEKMIITPTWWQPSIVISWGVLAGGALKPP